MFQRKSRCLWATLLALPWAAIGQTYSISTFAGGGLPVNISAVSASLYGPDAVAVDKYGNVFFTDMQTVLRLDAATGILTLVAGNGAYGFSGDNGPSTAAVLNSPAGIAVDSAGNVYIADSSNQRVRKVTNGVITTVAGGGVCCSPGDGDGGPADSAVLNNPAGLAVDAAGNLYIAEPASNRIREVSNGIITTVAGNGTIGPFGDGGPATSASLYLQDYEGGIAVDSAGNLYIVDSGDDLIRKVANGIITTVAGNGMKGFGGDNGPATSASLNLQEYGAGVVVDLSGNLYIADSGNYRIRKVSAGVITTVAGNGAPGFAGDSEAAVGAELNLPQGIAVDTAGNLYIADYGNQRVRKVSGGTIATVAGNGAHGSGGNNGPATGAELYRPSGVALDGAGNLYIADTINNCVRKVAGGVVTTVAGNGTQGFSGDDGPAALAQLSQPYGVAVDSAGNLYIADSLNNRIREVSGGVITTVAGNGSDITGGGDNGSALSAVLAGPRAVAVDAGANLYIKRGRMPRSH